MAGRASLVLLFLAAVLSLSCAVLMGSSTRNDREARSFVKRHKSSPLHIPDRLRDRLAEKKSFIYPAGRLGVRQRRSDDSAGQCGLPKSSVLETDPVSLSETAEAIQAIWVDNDNILIVASDVREKKTTVWLGTPRSIGIFQFTPHSNLIEKVVAPSSLQVADGARRRAVVVSQDRQHMFVSSDGGHHWKQVDLPSSEFDETEDLHISDVSPDHMILVAGTELYHTNNAGEQWEKVAGHVKLVRLAKRDRWNEFVFYLTPSQRHGINILHRLNLSSGEKEVIDSHAYRFAVDGHYLFVSRQNFSGNSVADNASRLLYVCDNFARSASEIQFNEVQLPSVTPEQFYVIMATHEAGAFIHVSLQRSKAAGGLYVSDSSGTRFSLSLSNHFYKVYYLEAVNWHYSIDDFYEVHSMRGVYITTVVVEDSGDSLSASRRDVSVSSHVTVITFNNGGEWSRLRPPDSASHCHYPACSLHLHLQYSHMVAHHFNHSYSAGLFSVEAAVGIIIGHGSIGETRNDSEPRLVLSNDGGYSWIDPGLPVGTYVYGIADYGNVIAVAPDTEHVEFIWFSHDRGECFVKQLLDTTRAFSLSRGLLMDPRASSLTAFVMGVEGEGVSDEWRMITLNFKGLLQRKCSPSDYMSWAEHRDSDSCLLGYKDTYNLTKTSSICYNEQGYRYQPVSHVRCACSYDDLECDYGYNRTDVKTCKKIKYYDLSRECPPGTEYFNKTKSGFRLIPGDRCLATDTSKHELATQMLPCAGHEKNAGYDNTSKKSSHATSPGKIVGGIIIALVIVAVAVVAFYGFLKCRERTPDTYEKVLYQKLPTADSRYSAAEDSSSDEDLITPSSSNPFQDT